MTTDVIAIDRLDLTFSPRPWPFAQKYRRDIDAYFSERLVRQPALWNGNVLVLAEHTIADGVFSGEFIETDYASFLAWRDGGLGDDPIVRTSFGAAGVISSDGCVVLGVMGPQTAAAGRIYFPAGTPDANDVKDGRVNLDFSLRRELKEETGLDPADFQAEDGWVTVFNGVSIAHVKILKSRRSGDELRDSALHFLSAQKEPELAGIHVVRGAADIVPVMPGYVPKFLRYYWQRSGKIEP